MQAIKQQTLENQSFIIEEVCFINCVLRNCDLFYSGGDFEWINTNFESCRFHWRGAAKNTLALFQAVGLLRQLTPPQDVKPSSQTIQ